MEWGRATQVTVDGTSLEAQSWGPPPDAAPTLVMLHEGLGSVSHWRDLPEKLADLTGMGVLAYSRAGYGQSDPATLLREPSYMSDEAERVLPQVLSAFGIKRCVLFGHSDGGSIALIYGAQNDPRVRGLILIAPHSFVEPESLAAIAAAREAYTDGDLRDRLARHHKDPDHTFLGWADAWLAPRFADWNIADAIDYLRVPTLVIQGDKDPYGTRAQVDEIAERSYAPVETLWLPGVGHAPHREAPSETCAAVQTFCARLMRIEAADVHPV